MKRTQFILCISLLFIFTSCLTSQRMTESTLNNKQLSILYVYSSSDDRSIDIISVDKEPVDEGTSFVVLDPGVHLVSFNFKQKLTSGGGVGVSVDIFGNQRDLVTPEPSTYATTTSPLGMIITTEAGFSYKIIPNTLKFAGRKQNDYERRFKLPQEFLLQGLPKVKRESQ